MTNWTPLTLWGRFKQYWCRYAPLPFKKCMVCKRWFWNWHVLSAIQWGIPEYCSQICADQEINDLKNLDEPRKGLIQ